MPWKVTNGHWQRLCVVCAVFGQPCTVGVQDYWQQSSVLSTNLGYLHQNVMITQRTLGISGILTVLFHQSPVFSSSYTRSPYSVTGLVAESMNPSNANGLASKLAAWAKISLWRTWCQGIIMFSQESLHFQYLDRFLGNVQATGDAVLFHTLPMCVRRLGIAIDFVSQPLCCAWSFQIQVFVVKPEKSM